MLTKNKSSILIASIAVFLVVIGLLINPIPQPATYHDFSDQRYWFGLTNAWNVLSNLSFAAAGIWGLFLLLKPGKIKFTNKNQKWPWIGVSLGLILTAIGSSYYHLDPDNTRLFWDRLPMTTVFMSLVAALMSERINTRIGLLLWPLLIVIGLWSVLQWQENDQQGINDLRFYLGVQVFTILVMLVMMISKSPYTRNLDLAVVVVFYVLAILFERFDHQIYTFTNDIISGHTLKHFAAAAAGVWLIRMIWKRKIAVKYLNIP